MKTFHNSETLNLHCFSHQSSPLRITPVTGFNRLDDQYSGTPIEKPNSNFWEVQKIGESSSLTWDDIQNHCSDLTVSSILGIADGHILFFWASSAFFMVERPRHMDTEDENFILSSLEGHMDSPSREAR